jgi:hypothetical protein
MTEEHTRNPAWWFGADCRAGCVDRAPNSGEAVHDLTAPAVTFPKQDLPASTSASVRFAVIDKGHSGVETWTLQGRDVGDTGGPTRPAALPAATSQSPSTAPRATGGSSRSSPATGPAT